MSSYVGEIITAIQLAQWVYKTGFSKLARERSGHESYIKFQTEVNLLKGNLENLQRVIRNAQKNRERISPGETDTAMGAQDDTALRQICGEFKATLEECGTLLQDNTVFMYRDDFVVNLKWNFFMEDRIKELRHQIQYHNLKVQSVLAPLEIQLQTNIEQLVRRIHVDTASRMDRNQYQIMQSLNNLTWLLGGRLSNDVDEIVSSEDDLLKTPTKLDELFSNSAEEERPECRNPETFPFDLGTDALLRHFQDGTKNFHAGHFVNEKTPDPLQYIQLAKCVWLVGKLTASKASSVSGPPELLVTYFHQLERDVKEQCARFKTATPERDRLQEPDLEDVLRCPEESFRIWFDPISQEISEEIPEKVFMDELMEVQLPACSEFSNCRLTVLRSDLQTKIVESKKVAVSTHSEIHVKHHDMNLKTLTFTPLYALPSSTDNAFNVKLNYINGAGNGFSVSFKTLKSVLGLQHALTGYYVAFDKAKIRTVWCKSRSFLGSTTIRGEGRLQLWVPKRKAPKYKSNMNGTKLSQRTLSTVPNSTGRQHSVLSSGDISTDILSSVFTRRMSQHQYNTLALNGKYPNMEGPHTAIMHEKPSPPMLVFYLENQNEELSFLTIKLDHGIQVNRKSCQCRAPDCECTQSSLWRTKGRRFKACQYITGRDINLWNVAALGKYQQCGPSSGGQVIKLEWIEISFDQVKDQEEFAGSSCRCKSEKDEIQQCQVDHDGIMRKAQRSYLQKLISYNKRNDSEPDVILKKE